MVSCVLNLTLAEADRLYRKLTEFMREEGMTEYVHAEYAKKLQEAVAIAVYSDASGATKKWVSDQGIAMIVDPDQYALAVELLAEGHLWQ